MKQEILQDIAKRLQEERLSLNMSQQFVADMTEKSRQQIINYETGRCEMTVGFLAKLHEMVFDVQYIVTGVRSVNFYKVDENDEGLI